MNAKTLVIVFFADETKILESDVAGKPAYDYLFESLGSFDEAEIKIVADGETPLSDLFEKCANISRCRLTDLPAINREDRGLLIFDARAWFSDDGLRNIFLRAREALTCFRIVDSSKNIHDAGREVMTLAAYLPPEHPRSKLFDAGYTSPKNGLEKLLNSETLANASVVESSQLDASRPPLLIDS